MRDMGIAKGTAMFLCRIYECCIFKHFFAGRLAVVRREEEMAKKTFITNILVVVSFILCPMSVLSVGATTQGEGTPSISERDGIIEKPAFYLKVQKGLLSVEIDNAPLEEVLMAIAQQNGFKRLKVQGNAALANKISIKFQNLPLDQGIQRILRGRSYSLIYAQTEWDRGKSSPTTLEEVRIFGEGDYEQSFEPNPLEGKGSVPSRSLKGLIQQALYGEDTMTRANAIIALWEADDSLAIAALRQALLEGDVYESALKTMAHLGGDVMMVANAIADKDSDAGEPGFVALAEVGGMQVRELIQQALEHENKEIRKMMELFGKLQSNDEM
jgi:hypothetical protein